MTKWRDYQCRVDLCERPASWDIQALPLCYEHGYEVARHYRGEIIHLHHKEQSRLLRERIEKHARKIGNREGSVVYYAQIGDYVKIGFSARLRTRLNALRVDQLLAVEPGGAELERERHQQFAADRIDLRRENFRPSDALLGHIEALRTEHGLPQWASLPRTSQITRRHKESA